VRKLRAVFGAVLAAGITVVFLAPANGLARGDGWELAQFQSPADAACPGGTIHLKWPVNKEYVRNLPQANGDVIQQVSGNLVITMSTDSGRSLTLNVSGPARNIAYANGDYEVHGEGLNAGGFTFAQAKAMHMPMVWATSGLLDFVNHPNGTVEPVVVPHNVTDVCAELGLS
jgi:hypothetical protein